MVFPFIGNVCKIVVNSISERNNQFCGLWDTDFGRAGMKLRTYQNIFQNIRGSRKGSRGDPERVPEGDPERSPEGVQKGGPDCLPFVAT